LLTKNAAQFEFACTKTKSPIPTTRGDRLGEAGPMRFPILLRSSHRRRPIGRSEHAEGTKSGRGVSPCGLGKFRGPRSPSCFALSRQRSASLHPGRSAPITPRKDHRAVIRPRRNARLSNPTPNERGCERSRHAAARFDSSPLSARAAEDDRSRTKPRDRACDPPIVCAGGPQSKAGWRQDRSLEKTGLSARPNDFFVHQYITERAQELSQGPFSNRGWKFREPRKARVRQQCPLLWRAGGGPGAGGHFRPARVAIGLVSSEDQPRLSPFHMWNEVLGSADRLYSASNGPPAVNSGRQSARPILKPFPIRAWGKGKAGPNSCRSSPVRFR